MTPQERALARAAERERIRLAHAAAARVAPQPVRPPTPEQIQFGIQLLKPYVQLMNDAEAAAHRSTA